MLVKLYALMWLLGILAVGVFYFTGNFTTMAAIVFGFLSFGGIFLGMMNVLPETVVHSSSAKH